MVENNVRLRKEYKLTPESNNFKVVFGTTNRINPSVIYLKLNAWVRYIGDAKEYVENVNRLNTNIKLLLKKEIKIANNFTDTFFYTPEIKKVTPKNNSAFHACFEITIKQKDPILYEISLLSTKLEIMVNNIIKSIENNTYFELIIKK